MRVGKDFYDSSRFHSPGVVDHVVTWCNAHMRAFKSRSHPEFLVAKRIKSLCLKNYKKARGSTARFCKEWEESPQLMLTWILEQFPNGKCKLVRHDKAADFEPSNITLKPLE